MHWPKSSGWSQLFLWQVFPHDLSCCCERCLWCLLMMFQPQCAQRALQSCRQSSHHFEHFWPGCCPTFTTEATSISRLLPYWICWAHQNARSQKGQSSPRHPMGSGNSLLGHCDRMLAHNSRSWTCWIGECAVEQVAIGENPQWFTSLNRWNSGIAWGLLPMGQPTMTGNSWSCNGA